MADRKNPNKSALFTISNTWVTGIEAMYKFKRYIHTIFIWIFYTYPLCNIQTLQAKIDEIFDYAVNIESVTLYCEAALRLLFDV